MVYFIIFCAKYLWALVVALSFFVFVGQNRLRQKQIFFFAAIALSLTFLIALVSGHFYYHPRPFVAQNFMPIIPHKPNNGFPSDHALLGFALSAVVFHYKKSLGVSLAILTILVGWGRIAAGIHSPLDVLGSFVIAFGVTTLTYQVLKKYS